MKETGIYRVMVSRPPTRPFAREGEGFVCAEDATTRTAHAGFSAGEPPRRFWHTGVAVDTELSSAERHGCNLAEKLVSKEMG